MKVIAYSEEYRSQWNKFVRESKNSTFLFDRAFLDYHMNRFKDCSLLIFNDQNQLISVLPANICKENSQWIVSHQGLTYGGFILRPEAKLKEVIAAIYFSLKYLHNQGFSCLKLKYFPTFYNKHSTDEVEYALFLLDAELYRRDIAYVIEMAHRIQYSGNIRREGTKAEKAGALVKTDDDLAPFWKEILVPNLQDRFGVQPVHNLSEITYLQQQFPENIRQHNVYLEGKIVAGTTIFLTENVAHCQYISSSEEGRKSGSLNFLFKYLIDHQYSSVPFFDFGIVNENDGRYINSGMLFWKESFGGRPRKHDFYTISCELFTKLGPYLS